MSISAPEFLAQEIIHLLRIGLALGGLHGLTHQGIEGLVLAGPELFHRFRIGGQDFVDDLFDGAGVRNLLQTAGIDDGVGVFAFTAPECFKDIAGDLVGNGVVGNATDDPRKLGRLYRRR